MEVNKHTILVLQSNQMHETELSNLSDQSQKHILKFISFNQQLSIIAQRPSVYHKKTEPILGIQRCVLIERKLFHN